MDNVAPCRLRLRVKFFVEPHLILQEQTRYVYQLVCCIETVCNTATLYLTTSSMRLSVARDYNSARHLLKKVHKKKFKLRFFISLWHLRSNSCRGTTQSLASSLSIILSFCFQYSETSYSNLFPGCFRGYYRSFWLSIRQEMWSSSSGAVCCSVPALRDPLCDSQDLCHCPYSTQNNFCCAFFLFQLFVAIFVWTKAQPSIWHFCRCCLETVRQASVGCFPHCLCFHRNKSSWVTVAAGIIQWFFVNIGMYIFFLCIFIDFYSCS